MKYIEKITVAYINSDRFDSDIDHHSGWVEGMQRDGYIAVDDMEQGATGNSPYIIRRTVILIRDERDGRTRFEEMYM